LEHLLVLHYSIYEQLTTISPNIETGDEILPTDISSWSEFWQKWKYPLKVFVLANLFPKRTLFERLIVKHRVPVFRTQLVFLWRIFGLTDIELSLI